MTVNKGYFEKKVARENALILTARNLAEQYMMDCLVCSMRKNGISKNKVAQIVKDSAEFYDKFLICFDRKHPEADYYRELLDREQRDVFADKTDKFEDRYPAAYQIYYDKPMRHKR